MVIEKLNANGYKVPEDISVTGFDNFSTNNSLKVPLTTVWINPEDTAKTATDLLIKKLNGEPYIKGRHIVGGTVIIRDSVKKID
jgi:DNA-binding LacI/PurR family transcriptional regulator